MTHSAKRNKATKKAGGRRGQTKFEEGEVCNLGEDLQKTEGLDTRCQMCGIDCFIFFI